VEPAVDLSLTAIGACPSVKVVVSKDGGSAFAAGGILLSQRLKSQSFSGHWKYSDLSRQIDDIEISAFWE